MYETIDKILKEELQVLQDDVIKRHEDAGQVASGRTRASFNNYLTSPYSGVLEGADYSGVLQGGRKPGKVPFEFKEKIKDWIIAKGLSFSSQEDLERWAKAIAWKIRREGTVLYRSRQTEDIFETPINDFDNRLTSRLSSFFSTQITNNI